MLQENSDLQDLNVLHEKKDLPKPNLRIFTEAEEEELMDKSYELSISGREDEARELGLQIPIDADMLDFLKEKYGMGFLLESGMNLSKAVEEYGEDWLNS